MQRDHERSRFPTRHQSTSSSAMPSPPPSTTTTTSSSLHVEHLRQHQRQQSQHRSSHRHRHNHHHHQQPSRQGPGYVAPRPPSTTPPAGRRRPGTAPTSMHFTTSTPTSAVGPSATPGGGTRVAAGLGTPGRMRSISNAGASGPLPSPLLSSPATVTQSPSGSPFSPATTMPIVQRPNDANGVGLGAAPTATTARNGPVSPGTPTLVSVPSLAASSRTSFQPLQDPRGPARSQPSAAPKHQQRRECHAHHHRSASWCSGEEEEAFAKTPFRFTPTRDSSVSPRSTPSPGMAADLYTSGLSPRYPSTSPARGGSRTPRVSPRALTPPDLSGDRCERLRLEVGEMLLQNELDNLTAHEVRSRMMGEDSAEYSADYNADDGTVKGDDDVEKYNDGRSPGDAKVLAKRQPSRTPAVFLPVSAMEQA